MRINRTARFVLALLLTAPFLAAQQHNSIPLGHKAYNIIEMGILRGAVKPPHSAKPWSEVTVKEKLREMLKNPGGRFSGTELEIVSGVLAALERKNGLSFKEGRYYSENTLLNHRFSFESGMNWGSDFSLKVPDPAIGTVNMGTFYIAGDMGERFSWNFNVRGGFFSIARERLGLHSDAPYIDPKYGPYDGNPNSKGHAYYYDVPGPSWSPVYSIPAYFPYTFTRPWDSAVFSPDSLADYGDWPEKFAFGYEMVSEINTSFFDNRLQMRFGRMRRDWGPGYERPGPPVPGLRGHGYAPFLAAFFLPYRRAGVPQRFEPVDGRGPLSKPVFTGHGGIRSGKVFPV